MAGFWLERLPILLASKSEIRAKLLRDAGVELEIRPAGIDEREVETHLAEDGVSPSNVAGALAAAKAIDVSTRAPGRLVIGADQTLSLEGERFTKPISREAGRSQLLKLAGRSHVLASGAALVRDGAVLWSGISTATLTMRALSEPFLDNYLDAAGRAVLTSVGGYQFEGLGAQLFERVEGDFHTILGLPLLPLLGALREAKAMAS